MRALSGYFSIKDYARQNGTVKIPFDAPQAAGSDMGNARMITLNRVYEEGDEVDRRFRIDKPPACIATISQSIGITDEMHLNAVCSHKALTIRWNTEKGKIMGIDFLVVGL